MICYKQKDNKESDEYNKRISSRIRRQSKEKGKKKNKYIILEIKSEFHLCTKKKRKEKRRKKAEEKTLKKKEDDIETSNMATSLSLENN